IDSEALAKSRKTELEELRSILDRQGLLSESDRQTSQDVNSDLQSFIRLYRDKLPKKGIKIKGVGGGLGSTGEAGRGQEGFGFSKYDGQWPSFEVAEAREIYKQKQIIRRLLEMLIQAKGNDPSQPLELLGVKRELVGEEDSKKKDSETFSLESFSNALVKRTEKIDTYAFRLELIGRTATLRAFIAELSPPFIVSDLEVHRAEGVIEERPLSEDVPLPFDTLPEDSPPPPLPIINDVNSRFVVTIEYLMAIHATPEQFLRNHYGNKNEHGSLLPPHETVVGFLAEKVFDMKLEAFDELLEAVYPKEEQ
ncbi:MAG: Amuc_1100 family pilus-like protein, partial [Opitutales bacterium]